MQSPGSSTSHATACSLVVARAAAFQSAWNDAELWHFLPQMLPWGVQFPVLTPLCIVLSFLGAFCKGLSAGAPRRWWRDPAYRCACRLSSCLRVWAGLLSGFGPLRFAGCPSNCISLCLKRYWIVYLVSLSSASGWQSHARSQGLNVTTHCLVKCESASLSLKIGWVIRYRWVSNMRYSDGTWCRARTVQRKQIAEDVRHDFPQTTIRLCESWRRRLYRFSRLMTDRSRPVQISIKTCDYPCLARTLWVTRRSGRGTLTVSPRWGLDRLISTGPSGWIWGCNARHRWLTSMRSHRRKEVRLVGSRPWQPLENPRESSVMPVRQTRAELKAIRGCGRQSQHEQGVIQRCRSSRDSSGFQGPGHTIGRFQDVRSLLTLHGRTRIRVNRVVCDLMPDLRPQEQRCHKKHLCIEGRSCGLCETVRVSGWSCKA